MEEAIILGRLDLVQRYIDEKVDPSEVYYAIACNEQDKEHKLEIVKCLASVYDLRDITRYYSHMLTCTLLECLFELYPDLIYYINSCMGIMGIDCENIDVLKLLCEKGYQFTNNEIEHFCFFAFSSRDSSVKTNNLEKLQLALDYKQVKSFDRAIVITAAAGNFEALKLLLDHVHEKLDYSVILHRIEIRRGFLPSGRKVEYQDVLRLIVGYIIRHKYNHLALFYLENYPNDITTLIKTILSIIIAQELDLKIN